MENCGKKGRGLIFLFTVTYTVSYMCRVSYSAALPEMVTATGMTKSLLSAALTGGFLTCGIGQLLSGLLGDRMSPKRLALFGLLVTSAMNICLPFCLNAWQMTAVWCVNGMAQAFMWTPISRLMVTLFSGDTYKIASATVVGGSCIGTIAVYLVSPIIISFFSWRAVFAFCAFCGIITAVAWQIFGVDVKREIKACRENGGDVDVKALTPMFVITMLAIVCNGMLRDGVSSWMPSLVSEGYGIGNAAAILTGVVLPVFAIFSYRISLYVYKKHFKDPMTCSAAIFGLGAVCCAFNSLTFGKSAVLSVLFTALLTACMHGVNLMTISMLPPFYKTTGRVALITGVLNSCVYVGSGISSFGTAALSDAFGWNSVMTAWLLTALAGTALCLWAGRRWGCDMAERREQK